MKFSKIDLGSVVGVNHGEDGLGLLIDRGGELEYLEIPAPFAAYEGLQQLNTLTQSPQESLELSSSSLPVEEIESLKASASWEYNPSKKIAKLSCSLEVTYRVEQDYYFDEEDYYFDYEEEQEH